MNPKRLRTVTRPIAAAFLILAGLALSLLALLRTPLRGLLPRYYRVAVEGHSMTPTLHPGDFLLLRRAPSQSASGPAGPAPGSLVAIRDATGRPLLKRIVGLPGESLRIGHQIYVNGLPLIEPYASGQTPEHQYRGVNRLAPDHYFLVGDNRAASTDSRDFGSIHRSRIEGIAAFRYWPPDRIGRLRPPTRAFGAPPDESSTNPTNPA